MKKHLCRLLALLCALSLLVTGACALTAQQALKILKDWYVDDLSDEVLGQTTLDGVLTTLGDRYTYYLTEAQYSDLETQIEGSSVVGIGVSLLYTEKGLEIVSVVADSPADKAGLKAGDTIIAVGATSCVPGSEKDRDLILGDAGTSVQLTVLRADGSKLIVTLTRAAITVPTTSGEVLDGHIGSIYSSSFGSTTAETYKSLLTKYEDDVNIWVVDMRDNGGGLADAGVQSAGLFGGDGWSLWYKLHGGKMSYYPCSTKYVTDHPVIVLTSDNTASAAEIFTSAIRETGAGISLGTRTFGKGVAMTLFDKTDETFGSYFDGDAFMVTFARFYTGDGNTTDKIGVIPTLLVSDDAVNDIALLLSSKEPAAADRDHYLMTSLNGWSFFIDLNTACSKDYADSFTQFLEALAPDAGLYAWGTKGWTEVDPRFVASQYSLDYTSRWFSDVENTAYADELNALATYGLLKGTGNGAFSPSGTLTRAQLCSMLCQLLNYTASGSSGFSDVSSSAWYADAVYTMSSLGFISGYGNGKFGPNDPLTEDAFITIIGRMAAYLNWDLGTWVKAYETAGATKDASVTKFADWAEPYAYMLCRTQQTGVTGQYQPLLYADLKQITPSAKVTRSQAGASLYTILTYLNILKY